MENFNSDNEKIDAALKNGADAVTALQTAVSKCGNCKITTQSYTGTGTCGQSNPNQIVFEKRPLIAFLRGKNSFMVFFGIENSYPLAMWSESNYITHMDHYWNGNTFCFYRATSEPKYQFNENEVVYDVFAFIPED